MTVNNPELNTEMYELITILSVPRLMGSEGERKIINELQNQLSSRGIIPSYEEFEYTHFFPWLMRIIYIIFICCIIIILQGNLLDVRISLVIIVIVVVILIIIMNRLMNFKFPLIGKKRSGKNIIGEIKNTKDSESNTTILLIAHYDSKSSAIPLKLGLTVQMLARLGLILLIFITLFSNIVEWSIGNDLASQMNIVHPIDIFFEYIAYVTIGLFLFSMFNYNKNESPGACDNATGCAILIKLAQYFFQHPMQQIDIKIIFFGAEEIGLWGSQAWMQTHNNEYQIIKQHVHVINIDMIGSSINLLKRKKKNSIITDKIKLVSKTIQSHVKEIKYLFGAGSDFLIFQNQGYDTAFFSSIHDLQIHSRNDTIEKIKMQNLVDCFELVKKTILSFENSLE